MIFSNTNFFIFGFCSNGGGSFMTADLRIAIDGGAATGKSTVSKMVSDELGLIYINTGQMYRLIALIALRNNLKLDEKKLYDKIQEDIFPDGYWLDATSVTYQKLNPRTKLI